MSLIVTWHPTYAFFHNAYEWGAFEGDLRRFRRLINGTTRPPARQLNIRPSAKDVAALLATNMPISVDVETAPEHPSRPWTGKDPLRAKLRTIGVGTAEVGLSEVWRPSLRTSKRERSRIRGYHRAVAALLKDPAITKVFQNGYWFDLPVLRRHGLETL